MSIFQSGGEKRNEKRSKKRKKNNQRKKKKTIMIIITTRHRPLFGVLLTPISQSYLFETLLLIAKGTNDVTKF